MAVSFRFIHPTIEPWCQPGADGCRVRLLSDRTEGLRVFLRTDPDNEELLIPMRPLAVGGGDTIYEATMPWDPGNSTSHYAFKLVHDGAQTWLAADGAHVSTPPREVHFKICATPSHRPPTWVREQVFYHIFPDRFCQGAAELAVKTDEYVYGDGRRRVVRLAWGEARDPSLEPTAFHGGDLPGIQQRLGYLADELGITALYLTPIFASGSSHRYDTEDYRQVDRHLGGNDAFAALMHEVHARGMRLVLDASINHTSDNHPWFNRYGNHGATGAYQDPHSPHRSWYTFRTDGSYAGWTGLKNVPVLDFANPAVREALYSGPDSVLRFWMREPFSIDGWRFDAVHMMGEGAGATNNAYYVREFRRVMKEENPQAFVLGEQFNEATRWLQGDQQDGAMNYYGFVFPVHAWLGGRDRRYHPIQIDAVEFDAWLTAARARMPYANQLAQLNSLDSHDTIRLLSLVEGDLAKMCIAVTLLLTYPGVPCIYYGDEVGLDSGDDDDPRRCFDWDRARWNLTLLQRYRDLIGLRRARVELRDGAYLTLFAEGDSFVFARFTDTQASVIALHRGRDAREVRLDLTQLPVPAAHWRRHGGDAGSDRAPRSMTLEPCSAQVWMTTP